METKTGQDPKPMSKETDSIGKGFTIRQDRAMDRSGLPTQTANKTPATNGETFSR